MKEKERDEDDNEDDDEDDEDDEREFIPLVLSVKALYNEKMERINSQTEAVAKLLKKSSLLTYFWDRV